jgi:hypothetical protein
VRLGARLVGAVLASLLLLPASAAWASPRRTLPDHDLVPAQQVPPNQWSHDVCTAVGDWLSQIKAASKALASDLSATPGPSEAKDVLVNFLGNQVQEADASLAEVRAAGVPKMKNGNKLMHAVEAGFIGTRDLFAREQGKATQLTTTDRAQFKASAKDIGKRIDKAGEKIGNAVTKAERRYYSPTANDPACPS